MIAREVRILMAKEWRHLFRSRGAMLTALFLPVLFLLIIPGTQMLALSAGADLNNNPPLPADAPLPPGLAALDDDPNTVMRVLLLPLFVTIGGLMVPSITAIYTMIAERENRTIELLVALPVRVGQILLAKLLVIVMLAGGITFTLFLIDAVLILVLGIGSIGYVLSLLLLLIAALAYSTASALLLSLLARDFRTANNLSGALLVPTIFLCVGVLLFVPSGGFQILLLAALFVLAAGIATVIALRVVTFERLLR
jgi:ABC-type transport system involved in multi-copper enzyme maturation permease subunit